MKEKQQDKTKQEPAINQQVGIVDTIQKEALEESPEIIIPPLQEKLDIVSWSPKTELGRKVKKGEINNIDYILENGLPILEYQIVDTLLSNLEIELINVGQAKGKFGGGKRSVWRQTQKKTKEGNKPKFAAMAVIGNKNGYVGIGLGKAKETVPAREKSFRKAKLSIIKVPLGCGSWECLCGEQHTIPFKVRGKSGSVIITLIPAPKGTDLICEKECAKVLRLAGVKDVYTKTFGQTRIKMNLVQACFDALKQIQLTKLPENYKKHILQT